MNVAILDNRALETNLKNLLSNERRIQAQFLLHLAEFDRRRLYERHGYANLWQYCVRSLNLSANQTSYRTRAVDVLHLCPEAIRYLEDGRICVTILAELKPVLTKENGAELLEQVVGKTKEEVRLLVATIRPTDVPEQTLIRRVPAPPTSVVSPAAVFPSVGAPTTFPDSSPSAEMPSAPQTPSLRLVEPVRQDVAEVLPVSAQQYRIRMLVDREWVEMLNKVRSIYSHVVPSGDPREVIARALKAAIDVDAKRHDASTVKVRKTHRETDESSRYIPADLERRVWERDGGCCVWKTETGLCGSTWQLEIDHIIAIALGGKTVLENLRLVCRAHNQMHARQVFGEKVIEAKIAEGRT